MPLRTAHATRLLVAGLIVTLLIGGGAFAAYRYIGAALRSFENHDITVTIPEGITAQEIDAILASSTITQLGAVAAIAERDHLEGYLFPDTYRFLPGTDPEVVVKRLRATFDEKMGPLLVGDKNAANELLIVASMVEREVPDPADRRIVAGIIEKRLAAHMPLQIDATVCYAKKLAAPGESCYPITSVDLTNRNPYNTYLYRGLPPGPIGNPGVGALTAAIEAEASPYWFYLSDPATSHTIFSKTNEEQNRNRAKYLK